MEEEEEAVEGLIMGIVGTGGELLHNGIIVGGSEEKWLLRRGDTEQLVGGDDCWEASPNYMEKLMIEEERCQECGLEVSRIETESLQGWVYPSGPYRSLKRTVNPSCVINQLRFHSQNHMNYDSDCDDLNLHAKTVKNRDKWAHNSQ
uniref:Uncharacterized protein n=1 Tax=Steinernema glaseri TaxID=37863 RepID=A0A1I7Z9M7_9BILA